MSPATILLTNALNNTNQLLTVLLTDPMIPVDQKGLIKDRLGLNKVAINVAKLQEEIND